MGRRSYDEKIEILKDEIRKKIEVYKATCRMRLIKSNFKEEEYIVQYHYLMLLDNYIKQDNAFKEIVCDQERRLDDNILNKLLSNGYDVVWNYIMALDFRYKHVDMISLFNNEMMSLKDFSKKKKSLN